MRPHVVTAVAAATLIIASTTGCKKIIQKTTGSSGSVTANAPSSPPKPIWKDNEVSFDDIPAKGNFLVTSTKLDIYFHDLPAGTVLTANGQKASAGSSGSANVSVDLTPKLAKLPPQEAFDFKYKLDPQVKAELDFGNGVKVALDAPSTSVSHGLSEAFKKAQDAPVPFVTGPAPKVHTVLFTGSITSEVLGPATAVDQIDWVANVTNLPARQGKKCSGYHKSGSTGGTEKTYTLEMIDQKVTIYDVRTTKAIASKDFKAGETCPMMAFGESAKTYASSEEQKTWLRDQRNKK